jgi:hypothetical protein
MESRHLAFLPSKRDGGRRAAGVVASGDWFASEQIVAATTLLHDARASDQVYPPIDCKHLRHIVFQLSFRVRMAEVTGSNPAPQIRLTLATRRSSQQTLTVDLVHDSNPLQ